MSGASTRCEVLLQRFLLRDLADWPGLPSDCAESEVARWLPLLPGAGTAMLGGGVLEYSVRAVAAPDLTEPVRLYFRDGVLRLVRSGLWTADPLACAALLQTLGPPASYLDFALDVGVARGGARLYPARGLMLAVVPATGLIASVEAFPPCGVADYVRQFRDPEPPREFPGTP